MWPFKQRSFWDRPHRRVIRRVLLQHLSERSINRFDLTSVVLKGTRATVLWYNETELAQEAWRVVQQLQRERWVRIERHDRNPHPRFDTIILLETT